MTPEDIASQRLTALEIKASFAEDLLDKLDRQILKHKEKHQEHRGHRELPPEVE